ncbi:MAG: peptidoglycan-associated lipoprotein Pal [Gammaproteobacteria bacterium]|nr:peptidoglycan-associated lipoprotein Pal [Gammaproteobacteria bacterium]
MNKKILLLVPLILVIGLSGCGNKNKKSDASVDERGVSTGTAENGEGVAGEQFGGGSVDRASQRRVYFEFDRAAVDDQNRAIVSAHAAYLVDNPGIALTLEGHADERGTREYNLALGERRARAVAKLMQAYGLAADRITATSYGEERPVALGHSESAWQLNRRVEILYEDR